MRSFHRSGIAIVLVSSQALFGCAAKPPAPVVCAPPTIVQAPDPAVLHRIWEAGYSAGYGAATRLETRRDQQQQDELNNVPDDIATAAPAPTAPALPAPVTPPGNAFQSTGPATPISTGAN